jgi:hypothetical protein
MATALDWVYAEVKRPAVILTFFLVLAGAEAWSQDGLPSSDLPQNLRSTGFRLAQEQRQELRTAQSSLPDVPSAIPAKQRERFQALVETIPSLIFDGTAINAHMAHESPEHLPSGVTPSFRALYGAPVVQKEPNVFLDNHTSNSFLGRASYAASRLFIARGDSGKKKFNTSYLLAALASAAVANTTYRRYRAQLVPYQTQSVSGALGGFGSTVGGDAGKRIFQQFWPHIYQILRDRSLKDSRWVEGRLARDPTLATLASAPVR